MYERFDDRARRVMALANQEAQRLNHEYVGAEHILLGLLKEGSGVGANVLKNLDVDLRKVRLEVEELVKSGPEAVTTGKLPQTPRAKKVIEHAIEEARNLNHKYVGEEHLLLGLLREQDGVPAQILMNLALHLGDVREEVLELLRASQESEEGVETQAPEGQGIQAHDPLVLLLDPGSASPQEIAALFLELSTLYRMLGGSGITFKFIDAKDPVVA